MPAQTISTPRKGGPFGVCAAIGADFGFNPDILRVALAAGLLWNLPAVVAAYSFAALLMLTGRRLFPVTVTRSDARPAAETIVAHHAMPLPAEPERMAA